MPCAGVTRDGTVLLGDHITCDGFQWGRQVRVQTHVHEDHMRRFRRSKGIQDIIVSLPTRDLLVAIRDAELPYRSNLVVLDEGQEFQINGSSLAIADSGHMLGSVQVCVTTSRGVRIGYSSDFFWPLARVFEVDVLIINSPYGSPEHLRDYDQCEVEHRMVELVLSQLRTGPVAVLGYRGRLQHGMALLIGHVKPPVLVSRSVARVSKVYEKHGIHIADTVAIESPEGRELVERREKYLAFVELTEWRQHPWLKSASKVSLSAYAVPRETPILDYGNGDFRVALTDHADFAGTLEYVRASKAPKVLVHPLSGTPDVLADELRRRLGCQASVAEPLRISEWA